MCGTSVTAPRTASAGHARTARSPPVRLGPGDLTPQHRDLLTEHHDLRILRRLTAGPARAAAGAVPGHHRQPAPEPFPGDAASRGIRRPAAGRCHRPPAPRPAIGRLAGPHLTGGTAAASGPRCGVPVPGDRVRAGEEMPGEPVTGQLGGGRQSAWFFKQVGRAGYHGQVVLAAQPSLSLPVEAEHDIIVPADDEQCGSPDRPEARAGQVGPAAAGYHRGNAGAGFSGGPERRGGAGAGTEVTDGQARGGRLGTQPPAARARGLGVRAGGARRPGGLSRVACPAGILRARWRRPWWTFTQPLSPQRSDDGYGPGRAGTGEDRPVSCGQVARVGEHGQRLGVLD